MFHILVNENIKVDQQRDINMFLIAQPILVKSFHWSNGQDDICIWADSLLASLCLVNLMFLNRQSNTLKNCVLSVFSSDVQRIAASIQLSKTE